MRNALLLAICLFPIGAFARADGDQKQTAKSDPVIVSVTGKATDVRAIIADLFGQAKKNYVLQPGVQAALFLTLDKVEFEEALNIICTQAKLQFEVQNGIYFITKVKPAVIMPALPKGTLDKSVMARRLTTKLLKTDIRSVFAEFGKQTELKIEVDKSVPGYKLDAVLKHVTLRYALDKVTEATGLKYKFTDTMSILIYKPEDENKISISGG